MGNSFEQAKEAAVDRFDLAMADGYTPGELGNVDTPMFDVMNQDFKPEAISSESWRRISHNSRQLEVTQGDWQDF